MLVFAAFLGILVLLLGAGNHLQQNMIAAGEHTVSIQNAKSCAGIIDSIFANSGGKPKTRLPNCIPSEPHFMQANGFGIEKKAFTIAKQVTLVTFNGQSVLEVTTPDHYK